jgi:hypothetical protein
VSYVAAQSSKTIVPLWIKENNRKKIYPKSKFFVVVKIEEGIKKRAVTEKAKENLLKELKQGVTSKITTKVTSISSIDKSESSDVGYYERYESTTEIVSKLDISDTYELYTYYDKKEKKLYGIIAVEKVKLGEHYKTYFNKNYYILHRELQLYSSSLNAKSVKAIHNDIVKFNNRIELLVSFIKIIAVSGVDVPDIYMDDISNLNTKIHEIERALNLSEIEETIQRAQKYFENKEYLLAISTYELAKVKLPKDDRIIEGIAMSKAKFETQCINEVNNYKNNGDFDLAVNEYDRLFSVIPSVKARYIKDYENLEKYAFSEICKELDFALENQTESVVKQKLKQLNKYQSVNRNKYNKYAAKVNSYLADKYYYNAKLEYKNSNYQKSIQIINSALIINNKDEKYKKLLKKSQNKLYRSDLRSYKKTQPFRFSFQLGGGVQSQNSLWSEYEITNEFNIEYIPSLSFGLYLKFGGETKILSSGADRSRTNILGLRYNYVFQNVYNHSINNMNEVELVIGFARYFLFNIGASTSSLDYELEEIKINTYSAALALRMYLHPIELQLEFKSYMDNNQTFYPVNKLSVFLNGNFDRKVSRNAKAKIRSDIKRN